MYNYDKHVLITFLFESKVMMYNKVNYIERDWQKAMIRSFDHFMNSHHTYFNHV